MVIQKARGRGDAANRRHVHERWQAARSMTAAWWFLAAAIVLEVAGTVSMKLSNGFTQALPSVLLFLFYGASFTCLNFALRSIDVSVAYAIWSALGLILVAAIGILVLRESASALKIGSIVLIVLGVVGLYAGGASH
jgi:small multidrug resistance pump